MHVAAFGYVVEEFGIDEEAIGAVGEKIAAAADLLDLVLDSDRGGEAAEEDSAGAKLVENVGEHGFEVALIVGEMEDGVRDDEIERRIGK